MSAGFGFPLSDGREEKRRGGARKKRERKRERATTLSVQYHLGRNFSGRNTGSDSPAGRPALVNWRITTTSTDFHSILQRSPLFWVCVCVRVCVCVCAPSSTLSRFDHCIPFVNSFQFLLKFLLRVRYLYSFYLEYVLLGHLRSSQFLFIRKYIEYNL